MSTTTAPAVTDWAVWSWFPDGWMIVDEGSPDYCRTGAARRNKNARLADVQATFTASPVDPDLPAKPIRELQSPQATTRTRPPRHAPKARAWAKEKGYHFKRKGALPDHVYEAYWAAVEAGEA